MIMNIEEIKTLLRRKRLEAVETIGEDHVINTERLSSYYHGIAEGLRIAEEILGMLDKPNKIRAEK